MRLKTTLCGLIIFMVIYSLYAQDNNQPDYKSMSVSELLPYAEKGVAEAQFCLGCEYSFGNEVTRDDKQALKWFELSAKQGHPRAQFNLSSMYSNGDGTVQNHKKAYKWNKLAAEQGDAQAQFNLGVRYAKGEGVAKDMMRAYMWCNLAAVKNPKAAETRERVAQEMTPTQIAEAQRLSATFVPKVEGEGGPPPAPSSDAAPQGNGYGLRGHL